MARESVSCMDEYIMRQLARLITIDDIRPHPNADRLEIAIVGLWNVVVGKGQFQKDSSAIFCEIDCMLPLEDERLAFLKGRNEYTVDEKIYSRLKTMRLRGHLSQGLLLPTQQFEEEIHSFWGAEDTGATLADALGIVKYDPPEYNERDPNRFKTGRGTPFPSFIPKTDQERIQNLVEEYNSIVKKFESNDPADYEYFEVTYKLDGSSITCFANENKLGVCSRNNYLAIPDDWHEAESHFIEAAIEQGVLFKLALYHSMTGRNIALQGELCGPGIQSNFEGLDKHEIFIYDVYDIDARRYLLPEERRELVIWELGLQHVPIFSSNVWLECPIEKILESADGASGLNGKFREGLVYKSTSRDFSFKAIGNSYLLARG